MVTIYCALYMEAQYLIQYYELKKEPESRHFQVFSNEDKQMRLVITGVGKINAAVAVAEISTIYSPADHDLIVNYGSCAAENGIMSDGAELCGGASVPPGSIIMVNKLTDVESGRTFYPDMIYRHPFAEGEVETSVHVYTADAGMREKPRRLTVHDMEAAAFYEAGNFFYGPHQMMFLKVVTDHGVSSAATMQKEVQNVCDDNALSDHKGAGNHGFDKGKFAQAMQTAGVAAVKFLDGVLAMVRQEEVHKETDQSENPEKGTATVGAETFRVNERKTQMQGDIQEYADRLAEDLHCSVTMRAELEQLLTYWRLAGFDAEAVIDGYYRQGFLPCKDKREGRRVLDELQSKWL